jgi:hypothetical protein
VSIFLAVVITAGALAVAVSVMLVARRLAPDGGYLGMPEPNHTGSALSVLGTGFAILTAFVLLLAFQSFLNAKRNADAEARATQEQFRLADYFPAAHRERLEGELVCYARAVVLDEWPSMRHGGRSELVDRWRQAINGDIHLVPVRDQQDAIEYSEWFDQRALREQGRRERLQEAAPFIPPLLWVALVMAALILVGYVCIFANRSIRWPFQLAVVCAVTAVAAMNLCVVRFLDTPYADVAGSIKPSSMRQSLGDMERGLSPAAPGPPCDGRGRPARV